MRKVKVLHVGHAVGGVDVYLRLIFQTLDPVQFDSVIAHGLDDSNQPYIDRNSKEIPHYQLPITRDIHPIKDLQVILKLINIIRQERPDVIHAHSSKGGVFARIAGLFFKTKVLYTPHAFSFLSTSSLFKRKLYIGIEKVLRPFSVVVATSYSEANRARVEVGFPSNRIEVYENSIHPIDEFLRFKPSSIQLPEHYICSIGRPSYQKNIEVMVEVFKQLSDRNPNLHMILMGVGYYAPNLDNVKELIKKYGLEQKFLMIPWIAREDVFPVMEKSLLYISTSRYEGLPYSVIEALAMGKACVVSDCDGNRDLVEQDKNGYVISEAEIATQMPKAIQELLDDSSKRKEFEQHSKQKFELNYNIENTITKLEAIYRKYSN